MATSYEDVEHVRREASAEALLEVLRLLGAPLDGPEDVPAAIRDREQHLATRTLEPVTVLWEGSGVVTVRLTGPLAEPELAYRIESEGGAGPDLVGEAIVADLRPDVASVEGIDVATVRVPLANVPPGYHRFRLLGAAEASTLLISAPRRCPSIPARVWGLFLPLYAARSKRNWGCGDFTDLEELFEWTESRGGRTVGTLPLLSALLGPEPFEPSPYSPASRLFYNELFVDVERVPELERSEAARALLASPGFRRDLARARRRRLVDYELVASLKRRALEPLAREGFVARKGAIDAFLRRRPEVAGYARFRAAMDRHRAPWQEWPASQRDGRLTARDVDADDVRYHQYVQFVAEEQLAAVARTGTPGEGLYLDLPLGVHGAGYDTWRHRDVFAIGANGGAPPDQFFVRGQDWGFPPLHPERARARGHDYFVAAIRNVLRYAGALRIDHVMGLHRMYWVPPGFDATQGVYVAYPAEELYAILSLEAHRADSAIVGEDLGTVPPEVRRAMARHGVLRSYVLQLETLDPDEPVPDPRRDSLASLNTHDMPTFTSFWEELDVDDRVRQRLLDGRGAARARRERSRVRGRIARDLRERGLGPGRPDASRAAEAAHRFLAASDARMVVVNAEDLWGETEPQNRPGTGSEQPNWRRRAARTLDDARSDPEIAGRLEEIDRLRSRKRPRSQ